MLTLPPKHSAADTTIFTVMSGLAQQHSAINLSQGFPDFQVDPALAVHLHEAAAAGHNQYAPMAGLPLLREAIAAGLSGRYGITVDPDAEVTVTPGATYAVYTALTAVLSPGDEVIILEPAYDSYIPNIEMNGARVVPVSLRPPEFTVDWEAVKDAISPRTRAIIVNTPHNPTGAIWQSEDWNTLADLVRDTDIIVISDEVYEQLVYDGQRHCSVLQHPELRERSFALYSFGKVYHNTGWKIGYCVAPPAFTKAFRRIHQFLAFSVHTPAQMALARYLSQQPPPVHAMMQQKRDYFLDMIRTLPFTIYSPSAGSYFQIAGYERISSLPDTEFAQWLTITCGVATIPVSAFYKNRKDDRLIRFCFAKKDETLSAAIRQMQGVAGVTA